MSKELEALENLGHCLTKYTAKSKENCSEDLMFAQKNYGIIKQALQALEIIKKNDVDIYYLKLSNNYRVYNTYMQQKYLCCADKGLTEQEFNLLKEILK